VLSLHLMPSDPNPPDAHAIELSVVAPAQILNPDTRDRYLIRNLKIGRAHV